jgi:hypothetical protein
LPRPLYQGRYAVTPLTLNRSPELDLLDRITIDNAAIFVLANGTQTQASEPEQQHCPVMRSTL